MGESRTGSGMGFGGWLVLLFIGLKLAGIIQWSWWLVLSPIWGGMIVAAVILAAIYALERR